MSSLSDLVGGRSTEGPPDRVARWLKAAIAVGCTLLLMAMMGLTVADVLGRYLMNAPVRGATEVTELMLAGVIFLGLPAATLDHDHVTVDLLTSRFPGWVERLRVPVVLIATAGIQAVIGWRLWVAGAQVGSYGGTTATLEIPVAPIGYCAAVLCGLSALIMVVQAFHRPQAEC